MKFDHLTPETAKKVVVEWPDIKKIDNWNEVEEDLMPLVAVSIGWLLLETEQFILIASSYDYDNAQWADYHSLPKYPPQVVFL